MDVVSACAVLGVDEDANLVDAKRAFRLRARMLHPDGVANSLRPEAEKAMSQLNEALETLSAHLINQTRVGTPRAEDPTAGSTYTPPTILRQPYMGECDLCGWSPAEPLTLWRTTGLVLFWRWHRMTYDVCRNCGEGLYAEAQAQSMVKGWWGPLAFFATWINLIRNYVAIRRRRRTLDYATHRADDVATVVSTSPQFTKASSRPGPILASILAVAVAALVVGGVVHSSSSSGSGGGGGPSTPASRIGTCLTAGNDEIDCDSAAAAWRLNAKVADASFCSGTAFETNVSHEVYCAEAVTP
jgi:hypothetical protein